ncbi:alkaline phosphatase family protein [Nocardioides currus]|uniref:Alkaline phosphatase family protein n=1 Tax=Nocardioides currus TaxID=2133958 RepID=A0A2R7YTF6_9ACTN|nr:nucleotide pyrophosphatase/phosphodiesterase family protein [Nocardioides currus]PUA79668.1 alkaline phosphatase family protein [Nocardioides currus]
MSHPDPRPDGFTLPAYGDRSLGDVVPAVARALGVGNVLDGTGPSGLVLPDAGAYVVFLIDGLGAELLRRYAHAAPFLASLAEGGSVGTAGVPSTTATSLTSLGTGLVPGAHGLIGYTARIPGTDRLINHLTWDKHVDPLDWQPHPTAFARLGAAGVHVTVVNKREFDGSGLTVAAHRGATYVGADRVGERIAAMVGAAAYTPSLTYVYDSDLDWTGHKFGVASTQWLQQLAMVDAEAEQMREALPASVRLLVVADHGMVDSAVAARVDVDEVVELRDGVSLLGGEARFRHLYCSRGAVDSVVATWREVLGERALVLTRDDAVARGWFGEVSPGVLPRVGDVMVACHDDAAIVSSADFPYEKSLVGMHGSLTAAEMLIPILVG